MMVDLEFLLDMAMEAAMNGVSEDTLHLCIDAKNILERIEVFLRDGRQSAGANKAAYRGHMLLNALRMYYTDAS